MSKTIKSPVKEFPGSVELPEYLTFPQAIAYEQSILETQALFDGARELDDEEDVTVSQIQYDASMIGVICECVEQWDLKDLEQLSPETFPSTPRVASAKLVAWLFEEITKMFRPEVPNE
jgi:hypothetical protein